jgi:lipopolysaccharide export system protein LptC
MPEHDDQKKAAVSASFVRFRDTRKAAQHVGLYARWVGRLQRALPVVVGCFLLGLIAWPVVTNHQMAALVTEAAPNLMVENLNFTGLNEENQPYSLTAARAFQAGGAKNLIDLDQPKGEMTLDDGAWLAGRATYGRFDQKGKRLWLGGQVELFHDQGMSFSTDEMQVDLQKNAAWGDQPVVIKGAFGNITGDGFRALEGGEVLVVEGHAKARLNLHHLRNDANSGKKP